MFYYNISGYYDENVVRRENFEYRLFNDANFLIISRYSYNAVYFSLVIFKNSLNPYNNMLTKLTKTFIDLTNKFLKVFGFFSSFIYLKISLVHSEKRFLNIGELFLM